MVRQVLPLREVDDLQLTIVSDNSIDLTLPGNDVAERLRPTTETVRRPFPIAEHGFSALLNVRAGNQHAQLLFDTGMSAMGLLHNLDALEIRAPDIRAVVLSHGHFDHAMGLLGLIDRLGSHGVPLVLHPDAYLERKLVLPSGQEVILPTPLRSDFRRDGIEVIEEIGPSMLVDAMVLVSGEVGRTTGFEPGLPAQWAKRHADAWEPDPLVRDDQCAVVNVKNKGLVVITGCGHAGVINIVRHAQALTGVQQVHAVVGGFHLNLPNPERIVEPTIAALVEINPRYLIPGHCTGFPAMVKLAQALPSAYLPNSVGTTYRL